MGTPRKPLPDDGRATDPQLKEVEAFAEDGKPVRYIAAHFGVPYRKFKTIMDSNKGDNPLRLAWERGHAKLEAWTVEKLKSKIEGTGKDAAISLFFFAKSQLGWSDRADAPSAGVNAVQIILPGAMSREDYMRKIGVKRIAGNTEVTLTRPHQDDAEREQ